MTQTFARISDGVVVEVVAIPDGVNLADCFQADVAATFVSCASTVQQGYTYSGKKFAAPVAPAVTAADLIAYAAGKRYAVEIGGYTYSSHPIATDRDSQSKITSVAVAAGTIGSTFSTEWKCSDGSFFTLNHDDAIAMATAVMTFVSACFATEASVAAAITAGTIASIADIDAASWPSSA
ncbi:MAG TPA: DUF4376 domain-containing protein [Rhizobium sp.]